MDSSLPSRPERPSPTSAERELTRSSPGRPALRLLLFIILGIAAANLLSTAVSATGLPLSRELSVIVNSAVTICWLFATLYLFCVGPLVLQLKEGDRKREELLKFDQELQKELAQIISETAAIKALVEAETAARQQGEGELVQLKKEFERRVQDRTAQLETANRHLQTEMEGHLRAAAALRESENGVRLLVEQSQGRLHQLLKLLDSAEEALVLCDPAWRIVAWNHSAARIYGWTAAEALDRDWFELLAGQPAPALREEVLKSLQQANEWHGEFQQVAKGGQSITVHAFIHLNAPTEGQPGSVTIRATDSAQRKQPEDPFLRDERLESTRALASGLAQELNNVLTTVLLSAEMLRSNLRDKDDQDLIAAIESSAQRSAELLRQTLIFARGIDGERVAVEASRLIADILEIAREIFPRKIRVTSEIQQGLWKINGDPTQLHHILLKIVVQAQDGMLEGGVLRLRASNRQLDGDSGLLQPGLKPGAYVAIAVEGTGARLSALMQETLFEPFRGGHDGRLGTGLGLAVVLGMVQSHGGAIHVHGNSGPGTTVELLLPAVEEHLIESRDGAQENLAGHGELILVVEEEVALREVTRATLSKHGFEVLATSDGLEALGLLYQHQGRVRLVLTTMTAPSMDGPALARAARQVDPHIRIMASSSLGRSLGQANKLAALQSIGIDRLLSKPYQAVELVAAVREELAHTARQNR